MGTFLTSTIGALVIRVHEQLQLVDLSAESQLASEQVNVSPSLK